MKLWGGRFTGETNQMVEIFNASINFDQRLFHYDIQGSRAHVKMLARAGIITREESQKILSGLKEVEEDIEQGRIEIDYSLEDVHTLVEKHLIDKIGSVGGKLHTARSRNDQVALDMRLYIRDVIENLQDLLTDFLSTLLGLSFKYKNTIMPGYTHLQRAQPITLGHHLLAYYFKLKRDYERWEDNFKRVNILPLGSGALAGTSFPIDREWVAEELQFSAVSRNSLDGVSDRDFLLEFLSIASTLMTHLSRFSEELILWSSSEFDFIELDDSFTTGSSIMPQKKNPDVAELVRGKTGRVYGHLIQLFTTLKGLPLAYNKDMQEDKEGIFDTVDTIKLILEIFPVMLETMKVNDQQLNQAAREGFTNATELANYLVKQDIPFRKAHEIVGKAVLYAVEKGQELTDISVEKWQQLFPDLKEIFSEEIYESLQVNNCVNNTVSSGGPSPAETEKVISEEKQWLANRTE